MKPSFVLAAAAVVLGLAVLITLTAPVMAASSNCDQFGDCLSPALTTIHGNPSGTFFPGDSFTVSLDAVPGTNMTVYHTKWTYSATEFAMSGGMFTIGNHTGTYTITAVVTFHGLPLTPQAKNSSSLSVTETVNVVPIYLGTPTIGPMFNVTSPSTGQLLRNPDGSFYKNDSFCTQWSETFTLSQQRPDINVVASIAPNETSTIRIVNSTRASNTAGKLCYAISNSAQYRPYDLSLSFSTLSPSGLKTAHIDYTKTPFTVVRYDPLFKYFVYMDYNNLASTSYARPFVLIVQYEGNNPGLPNYPGNANTAPITSSNDTRERAWINNFTYTVTGYNTTYTYNGGPLNVTQVIPFTHISNTNITLRVTNSTQPDKTKEMFFSHNNLYKYYFHISNMTTLRNDVYNEGILYYNVEVHAWSQNYAGNDYNVFNTPYVYQPILLNGNLTFRSVGPNGAPYDHASISLTINNPMPLNVMLIGEFNSTFGNHDNAAFRAFKADLSNDAYNYTETITPYYHNQTTGTWTWRLNQTSISSYGVPNPTITVNATATPPGRPANSVTYTFQESFTEYLIGPSLFPTAPNGYPTTPSNSTLIYSMGGTTRFLASPLDLTPYGGDEYLLYLPNLQDTFLTPIQFPGPLSTTYANTFGYNSTVYANLYSANGDIEINVTNSTAGAFQTSLIVNSASGGLKDAWVGQTTNISNCTSNDLVYINGTKICKIYTFIPQNTLRSPIYPPGLVGAYQFSFTVGASQSYVIGYDNSWGASGTLYSFTVPGTPPSAPTSILYWWAYFMAILSIVLFVASRYLHFSPLKTGNNARQ
ncbi:MAG: hypothetical protein JRN68_00180 [Nitrososphaerota archaeon]|nr:hypothetical protein [Nitrososphaerota archaeon]